MPEKEGITDSVNDKGQMVISVHIFTEEFEKQYNGEYIIDRPKFKHRDIIAKILDSMKTTDSWQEVAVKIAKQRNVQVKHVTKMLQEGKLTPEEEELFNQVTDGLNTVDLQTLYKHAPELLLSVVVDAPIELKTAADFEDLPLALGRVLYEKSFHWVVEKLTVAEERRKK